jgi:tetrahydromethanopterin S-methyltransferase subunit G
MAKKDITINDLAVMVQKGFNEVDKRFEQVDERFEQVDRRLDGIESSMVTKAEMNRRFDGLEDRVLASHQKRIEKLEAEVKELREMFAT